MSDGYRKHFKGIEVFYKALGKLLDLKIKPFIFSIVIFKPYKKTNKVMTASGKAALLHQPRWISLESCFISETIAQSSIAEIGIISRHAPNRYI